MEITNLEIMVVRETLAEAKDVQLHELNELQLALVGGGIADPMIG